ncbi:glycosyltransferase [Alphaproteobacteria bacterium]|nr:glycosyltransferase [Alphaproteobacteria bacterium]
MKVGLIFDQKRSQGGGFYQSVNMVRFFKKKTNLKFDTISFNKQISKDLILSGIDNNFIRLSFFDKIISFLFSKNFFLEFFIFFRLQTKIEKFFIKKNIDLLIFLSPSRHVYLFHTINYISTVWDLNHLTHIELNEIRNYGEIVYRDQRYLNTLKQSYRIIVESQTTKEQLVDYYNIPINRVIEIPFLSFFESIEKKDIQKDYSFELLSLDLENMNYFIYPSNYWKHKNHYTLVKAIKLFINKNKNFKFIFCGFDKGNYEHISNFILESNLQSHVYLFKFLKEEELMYLYSKCYALIYPSLFGPTNLPILDSWYFKKPVLCSNNMFQMVGNAALTFDPMNSKEIYQQMITILDKTKYKNLISNGTKRLNYFKKLNENNLSRLAEDMLKLQEILDL